MRNQWIACLLATYNTNSGEKAFNIASNLGSIDYMTVLTIRYILCEQNRIQMSKCREIVTSSQSTYPL